MQAQKISASQFVFEPCMQHEEGRIHEVVVKQKNGELRLEKRGTSEYADDD